MSITRFKPSLFGDRNIAASIFIWLLCAAVLKWIKRAEVHGANQSVFKEQIIKQHNSCFCRKQRIWRLHSSSAEVDIYAGAGW